MQHRFVAELPSTPAATESDVPILLVSGPDTVKNSAFANSLRVAMVYLPNSAFVCRAFQLLYTQVATSRSVVSDIAALKVLLTPLWLRTTTIAAHTRPATVRSFDGVQS